MTGTVAHMLVLFFGVFIAILCSFGIYKPQRMMEFVTDIWNKPSGLITAVSVRMLMGISLILSAGGSRFPATLLVLGIIALLAAIGILLTGRERIDKLIAWGTTFSSTVLRLWLCIGLLFGLFLVYSVW